MVSGTTAAPEGWLALVMVMPEPKMLRLPPKLRTAWKLLPSHAQANPDWIKPPPRIHWLSASISSSLYSVRALAK